MTLAAYSALLTRVPAPSQDYTQVVGPRRGSYIFPLALTAEDLPDEALAKNVRPSGGDVCPSRHVDVSGVHEVVAHLKHLPHSNL
jgi:hypothetical protein